MPARFRPSEPGQSWPKPGLIWPMRPKVGRIGPQCVPEVDQSGLESTETLGLAFDRSGPISARIRPNSAQHWPTLSELGPSLPRLDRIWDVFDIFRPHVVWSWSILVELGRDPVQVPPNLAVFLAKVNRSMRRNPSTYCPQTVLARDPVCIIPNLPRWVKLLPRSVSDGACAARLARFLAYSGHIWTLLGRSVQSERPGVVAGAAVVADGSFAEGGPADASQPHKVWTRLVEASALDRRCGRESSRPLQVGREQV